LGEGIGTTAKGAPAPMTSISLLVNPDSGSGEAGRVEAELIALNARVRSYPPSESESAARSRADRLVVAGGDGSVAGAAAAAARAGVPLAVVPVGTANDLAHAIGLPDDLEAACRLAVKGTRTRSLELGCMGERRFVNVASIGLPPVAARKARGWKRLLGPVAYGLGAIRAGLTSRPVPCALLCDGSEVFAGPAWQVTVACTGVFGAGSRVNADPGDGALDAVVIEASRRLALVRRAYGLRRGDLESQSGVRSFRSRRFELRAPRSTIYNVDGEVVESDNAVFTVIPRAFEIVVG
jgi:diacylglycerol kinase (ATP)